MFRREVLRMGAAVGVASALAGCGSREPDDQGSQKPPEAPDGGGPDQEDGLAVTAIDYRADDSGSLVVLVTIANDGEQSKSGTLHATVTVGGETLAESTDVTVAADDAEEIEIPFEASVEEFERDGGIDLDLE